MTLTQIIATVGTSGLRAIRRPGLAALLFAAMSLAAGTGRAVPVAIDWVTVGDPGNAGNSSLSAAPTLGAVAYTFEIMKYEFTNAQYVQFLNAVDPQGTNPNGIYNANMGSDARGGITYNAGNADGSRYEAKLHMGDKPVNYVSWFDAARVSNWLHNGGVNYPTSDATAGAPQNTGAYTLGVTTSGNFIVSNPGAQYRLPLDTEWYKASFYKGGGTNSGYWWLATASDSASFLRPLNTATASGDGVPFVVDYPVSANFLKRADWNGQDGNVTTVGTNGAPGPYATYDMAGNVREMTDLDGVPANFCGANGGDWSDMGSGNSSTIGSGQGTSLELDETGFRLVRPSASPVPEIDPAGMGSVVALVTGALGLLERRRMKAA